MNENRNVKPAHQFDKTFAESSIARDIRALRKAKSLTLGELAGMASLSVSFLSMIERGKKKPSLATLQRLSNALGMEIGWFFPDSTGSNAFEKSVVVRRGQRRKITYSRLAGTDYLGETDYLLSPNIDGRMVMVMMEFEPGSSSGDDTITHEGEEAGYIVSGELTLCLEEREIVLYPGDSFGFEGSRHHRYYNRGEETLQFVLINSPVIFR